MTAKQWSFLAARLLLILLAACVALVFCVDPFEIYHRAWFYQPAYSSDAQMYANAGVARSYDYDSVIIGSSVTENCLPSVYARALGGSFVKLCMNAGQARDHAKMLSLFFAAGYPARGLRARSIRLFPWPRSTKSGHARLSL